MAKCKLFLLLLAVLSLCSQSLAVDLAQFDRGHRILLQRGLQIQAATTTQGIDLDSTAYQTALTNSNFTTPYVNFGQMSLMPDIPDSWTQWALHARGGVQYPSLVAAGEEIPGADPLPISLASRLVSICYNDEQYLNVPAELADAVATLAQFRNQYPNTISHTNQFGAQLSTPDMQAYMSAAQPDILHMDDYPWGYWDPDGPDGGSPTTMYQNLQLQRLWALLGNDGTGTTPIPYGKYTQAFTAIGGYVPSESQINLDHYASWAFGYTMTNAFTYDHTEAGAYPYLFERSNPFGPSEYNNPTDKFDEFAEVNQEGQYLGDTLVRLLSTDVRMVMGQHDPGAVSNTLPTGVLAWNSSADPYITSISANNPGSENDGLRGDVVVGYFEPLHEDFDGAGYTDELYFMIVNGLTTGSGMTSSDHDYSGASCQQEITLNFDFSATPGITSLQRVNRTTGLVEVIDAADPNFTDLGSSLYSYVLTLDGGEGDLFKFNTGAPFIQDTLVTSQGDVNGDWLVNFDDATIILGNAGTGTLREHGDLDGDGDVDADDLQEVKDNWGTGYPGAPLEPPEINIPEPATLLLLVGGILTGLIRRS